MLIHHFYIFYTIYLLNTQHKTLEKKRELSSSQYNLYTTNKVSPSVSQVPFSSASLHKYARDFILINKTHSKSDYYFDTSIAD